MCGGWQSRDELSCYLKGLGFMIFYRKWTQNDRIHGASLTRMAFFFIFKNEQLAYYGKVRQALDQLIIFSPPAILCC